MQTQTRQVAPPPPVRVAASYRVLISVKSGLHQGAAFIGQKSESVLLGRSPDCDLILMDAGVQPQTLRLFERDGMLVADVLVGGVFLGGQGRGKELAVGPKVFEGAQVLLRVGAAEVGVELLRRSRPDPLASALVDAAPAPTKRNWATAALAGLMLTAALAAAGGAVNASSYLSIQSKARSFNSVIEPFNARGAQLLLTTNSDDKPLLRGLIVDAAMRDQLERELRAAGLDAELQFNDVQQMGESLTRLARLAGHRCEAGHLSGGRFECDAGLVDAKGVTSLQALAAQVPGVVELKVRAITPPKPAEPVLVATLPDDNSKVEVTKPVARPLLPIIRHVAVGERESLAFDGHGRKLRVGDVVGGAKVTAIRFEGVEFQRDRQRYNVTVTPEIASAASTSIN